MSWHAMQVSICERKVLTILSCMCNTLYSRSKISVIENTHSLCHYRVATLPMSLRTFAIRNSQTSKKVIILRVKVKVWQSLMENRTTPASWFNSVHYSRICMRTNPLQAECKITGNCFYQLMCHALSYFVHHVCWERLFIWKKKLSPKNICT